MDPTYHIEPGYDLPGMDDGWAIYRTDEDGHQELIAVLQTESLAHTLFRCLTITDTSL